MTDLLIDFGNKFTLNLSGSPWDRAGFRAAIAAASGYGKSYLATVLAEELALLGVPFLIVDPKGGYRALKQLPGATVTVVRSHGGDIPLLVNDLDWIAETVRRAAHGGVVVDVSDVFAEQGHIYTQLLNALWRSQFELWEQGRPRAMILFVDEAQLFAPQKWQSDLPSLKITDKIARMGRTYGINTVLATQRPNDMEKNILAQSNIRWIGYLPHDGDFKAVESLLGAGSLPRGGRNGRAPAGVASLTVEGRITHQDLLALRPGEFFCVVGHRRFRFAPVRRRLTPDLEQTPPILQRTLFDVERMG